MRKGGGAIVANPVLVGATTILVVVVAVFLAYNANNGLPFVPAKTIYAEFPSGAEVNKGVEVREGGFRIGIVEDLKPRRLSNGKIGAVLQLKLDEAAGPFPSDSQLLIRPRAPLALKIAQFQRGRSKRNLPDGGRIPVRQTKIATDLDELYTLQDEPTREGTKKNLYGFGTAFAGRGGDLSTTIRAFPQLFSRLEPVMRNLADPKTNLPRFFDELADFTRVTAPVAETWARTFSTQADTFEAIGRDPQALQDTISKTPPTLDASIRSFRVQRPFLRDTAAMSADLEAASVELRAALPDVNTALRVGTPVTRRSVELNDELQKTMGALRGLATDPTTNGAIRGLTSTVTTLQPQLRFLGPYVTVCNYWNIFWTFTAEHFTAPDPTGSAQRVLLNNGDEQHDQVTSFGANEPANGKGMRDPRGIRQYGHINPQGGNAIQPDGSADCTAGQQGYTYGAYKNAPGPPGFYKRVAADHLNGAFPGRGPGQLPPKGPTYDQFDKNGHGVGLGPQRVPKGQTFTDVPGGRAAITNHEREMLRRRGQAKP